VTELEAVELDQPWDESRARAWWEIHREASAPAAGSGHDDLRTLAVRT
jgi:hypothetical protein